MRILLTTLNAKYIHINLAIRLLYDLNSKHEGLEWKEFTIKEPKRDIADFCKDFDVVAFSCYIWNITQTLEVAKLMKEINPNVKILLGGPEVSYEWEDIIALDCIDFIITGEGEIPFTDFIKSYPNVDKIANLVQKRNHQILYVPLGVNFPLDQYAESFPYQYDDVASLRNKVLYIETSRGCPYKCEFCLASLDNRVRYLPMESIKANLYFLMQHGKVIKFLDRTFNVKRDFTIEIFKFILQHHRPENVFQFEITADILHPDIVQFIHDHVPAGLFRFEIGIQTVNQKANLEVSRKQNFEKTKKIIEVLSYKIEMHLDLIVGLALDYWEDIKYSFEEVFKLFAPELQLGFLKFLKGTPMRTKCEAHGFVYDPMPPYQIIESKYLSKDELFRIEQLENALEIYWNKGRTLQTLKYVTKNYSIFDFLLNLGIYFGSLRPYHQYTMNEVYETIFQFAKNNYPQDTVLQQLIAVDYYSQYKIKPKIQFVEELEKSKKNTLLRAMNLDIQHYRYVTINLNFDFNLFQKEQTIDPKPSRFILQYTGTRKPRLILENAESLVK